MYLSIQNRVTMKRLFTIEGDNLRKEWGMEPDDVIVLYAGRFAKEKGIKYILSAAKKIESANPKIKFVFVGKGELENKIKIFDSQNLYFRGYYDFTDMGKVLRIVQHFYLSQFIYKKPL